MYSVTLLLLSPLLARADLSWLPGRKLAHKSSTCFAEHNHWPRITWLPSQTKVRIVVGPWAEATVVPRVAGTLIRELLDYNVEYVPTPLSTPQMYEFLRDGIADVAFVLWPANFEATARADAFAMESARSATGFAVQTIGATGYKARSGWYVPAVPSVMRDAAAWQHANSLYLEHTQSSEQPARRTRHLSVSARQLILSASSHAPRQC